MTKAEYNQHLVDYSDRYYNDGYPPCEAMYCDVAEYELDTGLTFPHVFLEE